MKRYVRASDDRLPEAALAKQYDMLTDIGKQIWDVVDDLYGVWSAGSLYSNCDVIQSQESFTRSEVQSAVDRLRSELNNQGLLRYVVRVDYFDSIPYTDKSLRVSVVIKRKYSNGNVA